VRGWLEREVAWLEGVRSRPALADPVREIERQAEQVGMLAGRARQSVDASLTRAADDITHTRARLLALSPAATLRRGYAIVQHENASVVRAASEVAAGERLTVRFADDQLTVAATADE
jgi:exodeoxyribonuclease VII large subunit